LAEFRLNNLHMEQEKNTCSIKKNDMSKITIPISHLKECLLSLQRRSNKILKDSKIRGAFIESHIKIKMEIIKNLVESISFCIKDKKNSSE